MHNKERPLAWIRLRPDGDITAEVLPDMYMDDARRASWPQQPGQGAWMPLSRPDGWQELATSVHGYCAALLGRLVVIAAESSDHNTTDALDAIVADYRDAFKAAEGERSVVDQWMELGKDLTSLFGIIDTCEQGHKFAKLRGHPERDGKPRCPHCMAVGLDAAREELAALIEERVDEALAEAAQQVQPSPMYRDSLSASGAESGQVPAVIDMSVLGAASAESAKSPVAPDPFSDATDAMARKLAVLGAIAPNLVISKANFDGMVFGGEVKAEDLIGGGFTSKELVARDADGNVVATSEPTDPLAALVDSMCLTQRHDFGLDRLAVSSPHGFGSGMTEEERNIMRANVRQLLEHHGPAIAKLYAAPSDGALTDEGTKALAAIAKRNHAVSTSDPANDSYTLTLGFASLKDCQDAHAALGAIDKLLAKAASRCA